MRDEISECSELVKGLGFVVKTDNRFGATLRRDDTHIWPFRYGWQVADKNNGAYINHRGKPTLREALEGERK